MRKLRRLSECISILSILSLALFVYFIVVTPGFSFVAMIMFITTLNIDFAEDDKSPKLLAFFSGLLSLIAGFALYFIFGLSTVTCFLLAGFMIIQYPFRRWLVVDRKKKK